MLSPLLLAAALLAHAQDVPEAARAAWAQMNAVHALQAHFEQTRTSGLVSHPLVSTGTLRFQRPDKMAWIVESPAHSTMIINGSLMSMAYPDLGVSQQVELSGDPDVERLVRSMMVWMAGDLDQVAQDYTVQWTAGDPALAVLTPRDDTVRALLGQLRLSIGGQPLRVQTVDITEPDGDTVHIALSDVAIDPALPADAFGPGTP